MADEELEAVREAVRNQVHKDNGGDFLKMIGTDGRKWAAAFCATCDVHKLQIDEDLMIGWFANAVEAGRGNSITVLPDGSAFFTAAIGDK
jgi:hypothetical protein